MPTRLTRLVRRDVVAIADGYGLGRPQTALIDPSQHRVAAIVIVPNHVLELTVYVRASAVANFDSDTIAIDAMTSLRLAAHDEYVLELLRQDVVFHERPVLSSQGQHLGRIKDVVLDNEGIVIEYWIRRKTLGRLRPLLKVSPDALTAPPGHVAVIEHAALVAVPDVPQEAETDPRSHEGSSDPVS